MALLFATLLFTALPAAAAALWTSDDSSLLQVELAVDRQAPGAPGNAPSAAAADAGVEDSTSTASSNTSWCGFTGQPGFIKALTLPPTDNLLLDLTEALAVNNSVKFVVTAMSISGTYTDGSGYLTEFASPMEETSNTMFEFRLSSNGLSVDVFRPQLNLRTSDKEMLAALRRGAGNGHFDTLGTYRCAQGASGSFMSRAGLNPNVLHLMSQGQAVDVVLRGRDPTDSNITSSLETMLGAARAGEGPPSKADEPKRVIISGGSLIRKGFFVAKTAAQATSYRVLSVKAYKQNLDVAVEYMMADGNPMSVGFSLVKLPDKPMPFRPADERLLYFTTDYKDLGEHDRYTDELPEESVNRQVSTIWRYNMQRPESQIRIHIDPTVPKRWRSWFRKGVEAWNDAFRLIGRPKAVRAVLPEDKDWPKDYDISDARFSTISWTISSQVVSMGIAKVDPRSGEILKSDIVMSDGWVRSWLGDLDLLAPNFTHQLDQSMGYRFEACSDGNVVLGQRRIPGRLRVVDEYDWGKKISLLSAAVGQPVHARQRDTILGEGLRHVVTHETGHILGLRHNFKGSLGVGYDCIRNAACTAERGLSASVMDYVPVNFPSANAPDVHLFSPVLGDYDKLAIRYGYAEAQWLNASFQVARGEAPSFKTSDESASAESKLKAELQAVLLEAEKWETCYDADMMLKQDPACTAYDMSSDPIRYYEDEVRRLVDVQRNLLNTSVVPGAPYTHYGDAVNTVLGMAQSTGVKVIEWLGGVSNQYTYRRMTGQGAPKVSRHAVPANTQKRALSLALMIIRPNKAGLLPPTDSFPYLVSATSGRGSVESLDLAASERAVGTYVLAKMLSPQVLQRLHAEEQLRAAPGSGEGGLSTGEFLALVTKEVLKHGLRTSERGEWDLQRQLVNSLTQTYESKLPDASLAHVAHHLQRLRKEIVAALAEVKGDGGVFDDGEEPSPDEVLRAHLLSLHQDVHSALCDGKDVSACSFTGSLPSAAVRPPVALAPALLVLGAALALDW